MKKLAIIGASYLQKPLVLKAKEMGLETHVFAWREGNVVEDICDYYYDISILEKDLILNKCIDINIDGIISIASDIAMPTVNYVAQKLNLKGNSLISTIISTDKFEMRNALTKAGLPCPNFQFYSKGKIKNLEKLRFPIIVKPTDRSGSRGVTKVENAKEINNALKEAIDQSINKRVIVEEFIKGKEFSVEAISYNGYHEILAITDKVTTGAPFFVEIAHHQPAQITNELKNKILTISKLALNALQIENGASHTEIIVTNEEIIIVEVAGRMGGDFIGSTLTYISTGIDTLNAVINISLGIKPELVSKFKPQFSGIHFLTNNRSWVEEVIKAKPDFLHEAEIFYNIDEENLNNSSNRRGYFIYKYSKRIDNEYS
jgi:biotin carboxylase